MNEIRELLKLAKEQGHPWYPVYAFAVMTGARNGEIYSLRWGDIDWENRRVLISKSYNCRLKKVKPTKSGLWREIPINDELMSLLKGLKLQCNGRPEVFPRLPRWANGEAAKILRTFCEGNNLKSIKFHTLRACFATQLIRQGIAPSIVMKICGWSELKTMQRYVRLAGIEVEGATNELKLLPKNEAMARIVDFKDLKA